jgi:hypothetical protein
MRNIQAGNVNTDLKLFRIDSLSLTKSLCQNIGRLKVEGLKEKEGKAFSLQARLEADSVIASHLSSIVGCDLDAFLGITPL